MKRFLFALLAILVLAVPAVAQDPMVGIPINTGLVADDTSVALLIRYIGSGPGKVAVGSNAITLTSGTAGDTADTTVECPLSAPYGGVFDLTNAACDTLGEVVDVINNTSGSLWRASIVAGFRTDNTYATNQKLLDRAATMANTPVTLFWDTSVIFTNSIALGAQNWSTYFDANNKLLSKPYQKQIFKLVSLDAVGTYASGTSNIEAYEVDVTNDPISGKGVETVKKVMSRASGATTVWANVTPANGNGLFFGRGKKVVIRVTNSAAMATTQLLVNAIQLNP
jgi:hypothetical protein